MFKRDEVMGHKGGEVDKEPSWEQMKGDFSVSDKRGAVGQEPKVAFAFKENETGGLRVVAVGKGSVAERIIKEAEQAGVPVRRDPESVRRLLREEGAGTQVPAEVYEIMATVIDFAQELNETWATQRPSVSE